ncbi:MAG: hypothetical protein HC843_04650 [Sphingomonadales bacterium]|nr:hypothetical protein [Sphingomonadales bacterium]
MGWTFVGGYKAQKTPKLYLDEQFTCKRDNIAQTVLASTLHKRREYYAAVCSHDKQTKRSRIFAVVYLIKLMPSASDGLYLGYKDMDETMGPYHYNCPSKILNMLSPTENESAKEWRAKCRENSKLTDQPTPKHDDIVKFAAPIKFNNGREEQIFRTLKDGRTLIFKSLKTDLLYKIKSLKQREYTISGRYSRERT